jgi:hypothetical protein
MPKARLAPVPLRERMRLEFRTELFNAWNHTQFTNFQNSINSPTFGIWNSARAGCTVQSGLKLNY